MRSASELQHEPYDVDALRELQAERPRTRDDCRDGPRPCGWITCRHHAATLRTSRAGAIIVNALRTSAYADEHALEAFADQLADVIASLPATCTLDVADANPDGLALSGVAAVMGTSRERIRQISDEAAPGLRRIYLEAGPFGPRRSRRCDP